MIIKRLSASFGRLSNETLTLAGGLNIIEAPNESGKSTWCAFIRTMLYGLRTDRDKIGYLSDKTRYRPWSGAPMEGSMDVEAFGSAITLQRTTAGKGAPMKNFSAVHTGTATPYEGLFSDTAGETLTGVDESVFERSAFISQAGLRVSQAPELEKRILSLVTTGDETVSYSEADARLRGWLRKRRFNKSGAIPALEEKLSDIAGRLEHIEAALEDAAETRLETQRLAALREELDAELRAWDAYEAQQALRRARSERDAAAATYEAASAQLGENAPSAGDIAAIRSDLTALEPLDDLLYKAEERLHAARTGRDDAAEQIGQTPFDGRSAEADAARAEALERAVGQTAPRVLKGLFALLALLFAAAAALYSRLPLAAAAVLSAAVCAGLFLHTARQKKALSALLESYGVPSAQALRQQYSRHTDRLDALARLEDDLRQAGQEVSAARTAREAVAHGLRRKLASLSLGPELEPATGELDRLGALLERQSDARERLATAESVLTALGGAAPDAAADTVLTPAPLRSRSDISRELDYTTARLEELTGRYNMTLGAIRAMGDPVVLGTDKQSAQETLQSLQDEYDALTLAIETLAAANNELQTRFSPLLGETAGRIISRLTAGRYDRLTFDKAFDAAAAVSGQSVSRGVLALSAGTADQIYLALRLAVVDLVLPEDNPCPLILDDALSNFDDSRAALALGYLRELSQKRQILLFTCHCREAAHFSDDVNVVRLP